MGLTSKIDISEEVWLGQDLKVLAHQRRIPERDLVIVKEVDDDSKYFVWETAVVYFTHSECRIRWLGVGRFVGAFAVKLTRSRYYSY